MSIDPEQLLALAKQRYHDAGVTLGWPMVVNIVDEMRRLQWLRNIEPDAIRQQLAERVAELESERDALAAHVERLENDLEEPAQMQADAYRQAVDKIHPYVESGQLPASLDASLCRLLKLLDDQPSRDARMITQGVIEAARLLTDKVGELDDPVDAANLVVQLAAEKRRQAVGGE